jgi:hypothetical protein
MADGSACATSARSESLLAGANLQRDCVSAVGLLRLCLAISFDTEEARIDGGDTAVAVC